MKILLKMVVLLFLVNSLSGCDVTSIDGNEVTTKIGEIFKIDLVSNATTGYSWHVDYNKEILKLESREYIADKVKDKRIAGSGGKDIFTFKALKKGDTEINFKYFRPWMGERSTVREEKFNVKISDDKGNILTNWR